MSLASALPAINSAPSSENYRYDFIVDNEGTALVRITYSSDAISGSSWVLVPRFSQWLNHTVNGRVYSWLIEDAEKYVGSPLHFYDVLYFSFVSTGKPFMVIIEYNFSLAAMVVESESTYGIFYSPQIGFEQGSKFEAVVVFPERFKARLNETLAIGTSGSYRADMSLSNASHIFFQNIPPNENLLRIQVGFDAVDGDAREIVLRSGIFEFRTVARYVESAHKIVSLYNITYNMLAELFNTTLDKVTVRFFIPDFYSLMRIGGYVPFTGGSLGDIYINLIFVRYVEGYIEVIALHELVHHFLWKAGISPEKLLWFHEGMAQYVSIEIAEKMGYKGAEKIKEDLEERAERVRLLMGNNFGFLAKWTPRYTPMNIDIMYTAAYYVVSRLAEGRGRLNYYTKFFSLLGGENIENNIILGYYLSLAAGESVFAELNSWGFNLPDIYTYQPLIAEIKESIARIDLNNPLLQPFVKLVGLICGVTLSGKVVNADRVWLYLLVALFIAKLAPAIALFVYASIIFVVLTAILKLKAHFSIS
ncbi:MAG: hypothetical protein QXR13_02250 [Candidatus Bathyarchaeia archaeon]